jgi:excisionase family DNA binding protein
MATNGSLVRQQRPQPKPGSWPDRHAWTIELRETCEGGAVEKLLLTPSEAAKVLSISRSKLYELIGQGRLSTVRIDTSRRVPTQALVEFIQHLQQQNADHDA